MKLFESDNIWKRRKRAEAKAQRPDTPESRLKEARERLTSSALWLVGAVVLVALGALGLVLGVVVADIVTVGFLVVLALYAVLSIEPTVKAYREWKSLLEQSGGT